MRKVELLAPAGSEQNFYGAINFGADAVYLGLSNFSARKNASNFTLDRLSYIIAYAHLFGVKVYVAVNTVIKNEELNNYFTTIANAYACGVDAFIVQDILLGRKLKSLFPGINLHLSTQAGINNVDGAKQALSYGFSRVILARETPFEEIKKIAQIIETEVFVQGALCTCFSGHCYFSSFIGGLSGNRGACRQPCRKLYKYEGKNIRDNYRYALSLADLSLASKLNELIDAGVKSFKIEGRMRSYEYVCASCDLYNDLLNGENFSRAKFENLKRTYNRGGYTEGIAFAQDKTFISDKIQNHAGSVVAIVSAVKGNELLLSGLKHKLNDGDCFKILTNGVETGHAMATLKNGRLTVLFKEKAYAGSELSITKDLSLTKRYNDIKRLHPINARAEIVVGEPLRLTINGKTFYSDYVVAPAEKSAVTKSEIKENLRKTDVYPFEVTPFCSIDSPAFIPKKIMNELRARAYKEYFYSFARIDEKTFKNQDIIIDFKNDYVSHNDDESITVISNTFDFSKIDNLKNLVFCPENYNDEKQFELFFKQSKKFRADKYLYVPAFLNSKDEEIISKVIGPFDGVYCEAISGLFIAKRYKKKFFGGIELNVTNNLTYNALIAEGATEISLSKELSRKEILNMNNGFVLSLGNIKIMSLIYCPFKKTCSECKRSSVFTLRDADGRAFKVRRYKLSECRFEVYNERFIKSKFKYDKQIFDFTTLTSNEINELLNIYLQGKDNPNYSFTSGNLLKGVE